jgi:hypothetical protein
MYLANDYGLLVTGVGRNACKIIDTIAQRTTTLTLDECATITSACILHNRVYAAANVNGVGLICRLGNSYCADDAVIYRLQLSDEHDACALVDELKLTKAIDGGVSDMTWRRCARATIAADSCACSSSAVTDVFVHQPQHSSSSPHGALVVATRAYVFACTDGGKRLYRVNARARDTGDEDDLIVLMQLPLVEGACTRERGNT